MENQNSPEIGKIGRRDLLKGAITAVIMAILTGLYSSIDSGQFPVTWLAWKPILLVGAGSGISYVLKNWLTNSEDKFLTKEPKKLKKPTVEDTEVQPD